MVDDSIWPKSGFVKNSGGLFRVRRSKEEERERLGFKMIFFYFSVAFIVPQNNVVRRLKRLEGPHVFI